MRGFCSTNQTVGAHLIAIGEPIPERDLILYGLRGLHSDYNTFVSRINMSINSILLDQVHNMLLTYENLIEQYHSSSNYFARANVANFSRQSGNVSHNSEALGKAGWNPREFLLKVYDLATRKLIKHLTQEVNKLGGIHQKFSARFVESNIILQTSVSFFVIFS